MAQLQIPIVLHSQEELAWFRDNFVQAAAVLGCCELRANIHSAQLAEGLYAGLERDADGALSLQVEFNQFDDRFHVSVLVGESRELLSSFDWFDPLDDVQARVQAQASAKLHLERKCRTQLIRETLEQNEELKRRLEAVNVAERAKEAKSAFLANMSHELRTPMNSILGFTRRLIRRLDGQISAKDLSALQRVDRNGERLLAIINDILDFSKLDAGVETLELTCFSLRDLVVDVLEQCEPLLQPGREVSFRRQGMDPFDLQADSTKIRQILLNLVSNAIKYGGEGAIEIGLERGTRTQLGQVIVLSVRDHGQGMDAEEKARLFTPFTRLDNEQTRGVGGTGLGLAICDRYAKLHQGSIELESELGTGSVFSLVLPAAQSQSLGLAA